MSNILHVTKKVLTQHITVSHPFRNALYALKSSLSLSLSLSLFVYIIYILQLEMREQDHALARRLVELRQDIQQVKLQRSYQEHQDILEEAIDMIDDKDKLFDALPDAFSPTLKQCGVTKMNLSTRRFSVF